MSRDAVVSGRRSWRRPRAEADAVLAAQWAQARAAQTQAEVDRARTLAQWQQEQDDAARAAAAQAARAATEQRQQRQAAQAAARAQRRQARGVAQARLLGRARLLVPLLIVNATAVFGQIAYAYAKIAPGGWPVVARLALAVLFAAAVESVAVYVGWHAHDALLAKATATAARLRRASYLIAAVVAGINYAHFADGLAPTAAAVAFGLLSLLSPWLWGLHTRRVQHVQLRDAGAVDGTGAVFSAERSRAFPVRTWFARRWSIDHNITDPQAAWAGYNADRTARRLARRRATRRCPTDAPPATPAAAADPAATGTGTPPVPTGGTSGGARTGTARRTRTGRRAGRRTGTRPDAELLAELHDVLREPDGSVPVRRAAAALGCGPDRARRLLDGAGLLRTDTTTALGTTALGTTGRASVTDDAPSDSQPARAQGADQ